MFLLVAELGIPVLSKGAPDVAHTAPNNSALLRNTKGIQDRDLFVPVYLQKVTAQSVLEASGDLQI